jgi:prepilin-type N-terminal cleavage/methylation domain-containing protein
MVLSPPPGYRRPQGDSGVTLIELLLALALSTVVVGMSLALFKDAGFAARLGAQRRDAGFQAHAAFAALTGSLMTGGGILQVGPDRLDILNRANRRLDYGWQDSTLSLNGKAFGFRLASLEVVPEGPQRPEPKGFAADLPWDLDSLDGDRDGRIGFEELDRDRSGRLEPEECRFIAHITVTMTTVFKDVPMVQTCVVHPRNRVPAAAGQEASEVMESGGIPDP